MTGWCCRSRSAAATAGCASAACTPSARPPRSATRAWARRCSASASCTARCRAARPSCCASREAQFMPIKVPEGPPDERFLFLSDVLPTAWQSVEYADTPEGGTLLVLGLGPIGDMACRIALHRGLRVIGVDRVTERLEPGSAARGAEVHRPARGRRPGRGGPVAHRRTWRRRRHRRGRHGGARLPRRRDGSEAVQRPAQAAQRDHSCPRPASTGWPRSTAPSTPCVAAAPSR